MNDELVELLNDDGHRLTCTVGGETVDEAIALATQQAQGDTDDDSYVMNEWSAA